jgi:MFS transporter, DHA3 family, macrolide efflux protein
VTEGVSPPEGSEAHSAPSPKTTNPLRVLRNRNFARLFFAGAASQAGFAIGQVAITWLVYTVTKSAIDIAFIGISFFLAVIAFSLLSGTVVDRQERRRLMIISDVVRCAALAAATVYLYLFGFNFVLLLAVIFVLGAFTSLFQPAERALTPMIIGKDDVAAANGLTQMTNSVAQFVSNAAGGLLIAAVGALGALGLNSLTFLASATLLATIAIQMPAATEPVGGKKAGFLDDAREGFRYIAGQRGLLSITVLSGIGNVFITLVLGFLVVYSSEVLKGSATVYGLLLASFSLGIGPGSLLVGRIGTMRWAGKALLLAFGLMALSMLILVFVPALYAALLASFSIGFFLGFFNTTWLTTVQLTVPSEMQGRYFGLDQLGSFATIPVGQILGGYIISSYGVHFAYEVSGLGLLAAVLLFASFRSTRNWSSQSSQTIATAA